MRPAGKHLSVEDLEEELTPMKQRHLARCPRCQSARASILALRAAVQSLPRSAPPPKRTLELLTPKPATPALFRRAWHRPIALMTTLVLLGLLGGGLYQATRQRSPIERGLAEEIALDHLHYQHRRSAAEITGTASEIADFFERTLARRPHLPTIEATYLVGGKRCRIGGAWSALVWLERAGVWLSLFALPESKVRKRGCVEAAGVYVCGAADPRGGSRVLVGRLPKPEMLRLLDESLR
jgi:anti-sigma factor RsiW